MYMMYNGTCIVPPCINIIDPSVESRRDILLQAPYTASAVEAGKPAGCLICHVYHNAGKLSHTSRIGNQDGQSK